jgi:uncharacterized protein YbjT (DUF2867 family)
MEGVTLIQMLLLVVSGGTGLLSTLLLKRLDGIAADVRAVREKVDDHAEKLAEGRAKIEALEGLVNGLLDRERGRYERLRPASNGG